MSVDDYGPDESDALRLDSADPLKSRRDQFAIPRRNGRDVHYFAGNSLGLQPKSARDALTEELDAWAHLAVDGHFKARHPWYSYHEIFRESGARLVGALPGEVVLMNSLSVNLHLMMVTFYRPTAERHRILIDGPTFPSDLYAVKSQLKFHGFDPESGLVHLKPRPGEETLRPADIERVLEEQGDSIALVLMSGVNFYTGQAYDMKGLTRLARSKGCVVGWDLAHAAGNIELSLHDWDVDFAAWCSYKYLNGGPGAVAGCFVHERHGGDASLGRFAGWWGNDPATRFKMHLLPEFEPRPGADGWQISNPPILAMAPVRAALDLFDEIGMDALRARSKRLTGYLEYLIDRIPSQRFEIVTPRDPESRGCQLSIFVQERPRELFEALGAGNVVADMREPNMVRVAPTPLYNTFRDVWCLAWVLAEHGGPLDSSPRG